MQLCQILGFSTKSNHILDIIYLFIPLYHQKIPSLNIPSYPNETICRGQKSQKMKLLSGKTMSWPRMGTKSQKVKLLGNLSLVKLLK